MKDQFTDLIFPHQALIHKICRMYRDTPEDQEDLFQEIIYQLWKSYPKFQEKSKISTWMYRIGLNTAMASFRKNKVKLLYSHTVPDKNILSETTEHWREELLFSAIRQLSEDERALIGLYLDDFSYFEIAEIIGISENHIGVRLNRIKKKLKVILNT
ncbi:RNA polymerase sigma factor [Flavobacterium pectinovorum]|uniref:Sigma-70 family RNA polymerase sigma factor n=1 Tax=Flavobacterium pectinovorum TaxID=29533 RepID=A0A502EAW7_9FLAO|nr:sigma-70 family RNA polymerase sigma factor [Flavobacterium pectinovorum]TPG34828.1 sigma-70 family RNA polymerase sigma factor [Flavobacterium pectinovorum]